MADVFQELEIWIDHLSSAGGAHSSSRVGWRWLQVNPTALHKLLMSVYAYAEMYFVMFSKGPM